MKKRIITILLSAMLVFGTVAFASGCAGRGNPLTRNIHIYVPTGAPMIAAAHMFYNNTQINVNNGTRTTSYRVTTGEVIRADLLAQRPDFALVPINLASQIFNLNQRYLFAGVALQGSFDVVQKLDGDEIPIASLSDLVGETIFAFGQNLSPGIVLERLIIEKGYTINRRSANASENPNAINITYLASPAQVQQALLGLIAGIQNARFGLLMQPIASTLTQQPAFESAFNLADIWLEKFNFSFPQVALIVRDDLAKADPQLVNQVIDMFEASITFARENPKEVARMVGEDGLNISGLQNSTVIEAFVYADGQSVFNFTRATEAKQAVLAFLEKLTVEDRGGEVPKSNFFFGA